MRNNCRVSIASADEGVTGSDVSTAATSAIINLDEFCTGLSASAFVKHDLWQSIPQAKAAMKNYQAMSCMLQDALRFVFLQQAAFSQVAKQGVLPEKLQQWLDCLPDLLKEWVPKEVLEGDVKDVLLKPVEMELRTLYSSGLDGVAPLVEQCVQQLLGAGLSAKVRQQLLQRIPEKHPLKPLVDVYTQAGTSLSCYTFSQHAAAACVKPPTPNHSVSAELLPIIVHTLLALRKYQPRLCCWAGARLN